MKVLALNSSPRAGGGSKTELMLDRLVQGMTEAGAQVEVVNLREKEIKLCLGCFACWSKTPGQCVQQDDMSRELYPKWAAADMAIYATPLYHYTVNAAMKAFIERTLPFAEPFMIEKDGYITHPQRVEPPRAVVLSVAGFPDMEVFEPLSNYVQFLFGGIGGLAAEIYRPAAEMLNLPQVKTAADDIFEAAIQAGRELVSSGGPTPETLERISRPLMERDQAVAMANMFWRTCITAGVTPKTFRKKKMVPAPGDIPEYLAMMRMGFNPRGAGDAKAVMQFDFSGEAAGSCHLKIADGKIQTAEGPAAAPDLTITAPFEVWMDIVTGKADGAQMMMEQKYQASGDLGLLMRMGSIFGPSRED
jgi:multimeric flavodoxin WrbA